MAGKRFPVKLWSSNWKNILGYFGKALGEKKKGRSVWRNFLGGNALELQPQLIGGIESGGAQRSLEAEDGKGRSQHGSWRGQLQDLGGA